MHPTLSSPLPTPGPDLTGFLSGDPERDARNVGALLDTIFQVTEAEDPEQILDVACRRVLDLTGAERCLALLASGGGESFELAAGAPAEDARRAVGLSESVARATHDSGQAISLVDTRSTEGDLTHSMAELELRSIVCVPLSDPSTRHGVLYADSRQVAEGFGPVDRAFVEAIARHAGAAYGGALRARAAGEVERRGRERAESERDELRQLLQGRGVIVGESEPMKKVLSTLSRVARTDATILILGQSGSGKGTFARAVHESSHRAKGPFVVVDVTTVPANLLESELFGHEAGAFTGATARRIGRFERASCGTIFLDEIGELPLELQSKLLRVLEAKEFERVGGTGTIEVDVRIVAATHRDLPAMVREGTFRQDLYYRLRVVTVSMPPLSERGDDILVLAETFLDEFNLEYGRQLEGFSPRARFAMQHYGWPGNVRELRNAVQSAVLMSDLRLVEPRDLGFDPDDPHGPRPPSTLPEAREALEQRLIEDALRRHGGSVTEAARELGIYRQQLQRYLARFGIDKDRFRKE